MRGLLARTDVDRVTVLRRRPGLPDGTGYAKVTRDFTDRKRAEEAVMLQLSSALLANMDVRKLLGAIPPVSAN